MKHFTKSIGIILAFVFMMAMTSCQSSDGRMLKKFVSRFNAEEYSCAATYIYPGDQMNLAFFAKEVKTLAPHSFIKIKDYKTEEEGGNRYILADLKWENATPALRNYFNSIGTPIDSEDCQTVKLKVRETNDGETLSFVWGVPGVLSDNLWIASAPDEEEEDGKPAKKVAMYDKPSRNSKRLGVMNHDLIVGQEDNTGWMPAYQVTNQGNVTTSYIQRDDVTLDRSAYFTLGIFDSLSLGVALLIIVLIAVPILFLGSIIQVLFNMSYGGIIIAIGLIFGLIYTIYQLLEKILFELFIINLPY